MSIFYISNGSSLLRVIACININKRHRLEGSSNVAIYLAARASYETWAMSSRLDIKGR